MTVNQASPRLSYGSPLTRAFDLLKVGASVMPGRSSVPGRRPSALQVRMAGRSGNSAKVRNRRAYQALQRVRARDFTAHSDTGLREAFHNLKSEMGRAPRDEAVAEGFALVSEAIGRRMGVWRLFDADFDRGGMEELYEAACEIVESGAYRRLMAFYTAPGFLESGEFARGVASALRGTRLDNDDKTLVEAIVYILEKERVDYRSNILLPGSFYEAARAKDVEGSLRFQATDEQIVAGMMMYEGGIVEMNSGEGKTIAAAFPAALFALAGRPVHVITANDYLAARDADWLAPVYESLGLSVGAVLNPMGDQERSYAYGQQIVYGTLREFGFDFLRDNLKLPPDRPVQGSLDAAIVDEADHVLLDQSRAPLIISGAPIGSRRAFRRARGAVEELVCKQRAAVDRLKSRLPGTARGSTERYTLLARLLFADPEGEATSEHLARDDRAYSRAMAIAAASDLGDPECELAKGVYYLVDSRRDSVALTERGQLFLEERLGRMFDTASLQGRLASLRERDDLPLGELRRRASGLERRISRQNSRMNQVTQMLRAYTLLRRDTHYVVSEGRIVLIDESTGRPLLDSRYRQGIHAALEAREGLRVNDELETLAQISVQGFVKQYAQMSGMTGTALDAVGEFEREFGIEVEVIPPSKPRMRRDHPSRLYLDRRDKLAAIVDEVEFWNGVGRPVLVGTPTIEQSEEIGRLLNERGVRHNLLNAVSNATEAEVIRGAGAFGAVTVATNMAGRGTDIVLEPSLNDRIISAYGTLVGAMLDEGFGHVELACSNSLEARALEDTLSRSGQLSVAPHTGEVVRVSRSAGKAGDGPARLEFGLGLYVIGTEMNESPRTDYQLRGRSGRQGEPGASRFIIALEDRLLAFRGDGAPRTSDEASLDPAGRTCYEGPGLERRLAEIQREAENDDSIQRGMLHEYERILEAQTLAYYGARREVMDARDFHEVCEQFVRGYAVRAVERNIPALRPWDYERQFSRLAEELWLDFGVNCLHLEGLGLDALGESIGELLLARLEGARRGLDHEEAERLEKLLFLQSSDELWGEHIDEVQELILSTTLGAASHKGAVADSIIQCWEAYGRFKRDAADAAARRMLNFDVESAANLGAVELSTVDDLERILA